VSKVNDSAVWIDIAGKATGLFDRREIMDEEPPVEGDQFIATVASTGVRGGMLMLSRLPLILEESRKVLEAAAASGEQVNGFVTGAVKGGLEVDLGGLRAFAPASHVDLRHGADLNYLVGNRLDFIVTQYAKKGRDIVVSRRKMLEEDNKKLRAEAVAKIEPGSVQKGIVRKVVAWGVFVALPDLGGVEGLIHMTEASHDRGARLTDLFKPGAEIEVKILRVDEKGKLWLSRKAVIADPWDAVKEKYSVGSRHKGKVARLQPFGAFIELEPGIDGLIHTADLSLKTIEHPEEVVKVGEEIEVLIASCDAGARKIGLHPAPPPGEEAEPRQRIQPHKVVKVAIVQTVEGGLIVRVLGVTGRLARGFIPAGHTGTPRGADLRKEFPVGTQLDAKVLEIDPRRGEAKLSIRAVKEDAEKAAYNQYRAGVAREAKFGTFADLMKKS
jgi:small subunit ribosomal protein S1